MSYLILSVMFNILLWVLFPEQSHCIHSTTKFSKIINSDDNLYDLFPMYLCSNKTSGYKLPVWYEGCLSACSLTNVPTYFQLEFFDSSIYSSNVNVLKYRCNRLCKRSHENTWGSCIVSITTNSITVLSRADIEEYHDNGCRRYNGTPISCEDFTDPDCSYWSDFVTCGNGCLVTSEFWTLLSDVYGRTYFKSPESNQYIDCQLGYISLSDSSYTWDTTVCKESFCKVTSLGYDECTQPANKITFSCPRSGRAFSTSGMITVDSPCTGPINITQDGVMFKLASAGETPDVRSDLQEAKSGGGTDPIVSLADSINDVISVIESTICTSICDLTERSFQLIPDNNDVVETPIGPWISYLGETEYGVIPCSSTTNYSITVPLTICGQSPMYMSVTNIISGLQYWWEPTKTFISEDTICVPSVYDSERMSVLYELNKSFTFDFWRGTATLIPPNYNTVVWSDRLDYNSVRSSKWFKRLETNAILPSMTLSELNITLVSFAQDVINGTIIQKKNESTVLPIFDTSVTIISKVMEDIYSVSSSVYKGLVILVSSWKDLFVVVITLVCGIIVYRIITHLSRLMSRVKRQNYSRPTDQPAIFYSD